MRQRSWWKTTERGVVAALALCVLVACASAGGDAPAVPKGPTDEELVTGVLDGISSSLIAQDVTSMVAYYADDFVDGQGQNKEAVTQFLTSVKEQGFLEGIKVDNTNRAITIAGETAQVTGVGLSGAFGVLNLGFDLAKRDGKWLVVKQTQQ